MNNDPKETIYIDVDDEITAVIDKIQNSPKKIIALVLPKRATVFQSIVNMKLLKRIADNEQKSIVLITSESALMPLAGAVGLHVARTLQSKPAVPPPPSIGQIIEGSEGDNSDKVLDKNTSVGELSGLAEAEAIEIDNSINEAVGDNASSKDSKNIKQSKNNSSKKPKIPNFEKFRRKLFILIAVIVLLVFGFIYAFMIMPKATITLKTDTKNLDMNMKLVADTSAQILDKEKGIIPAVNKESKKVDAEKVPATGEKNVGTKATGEVTMSIACADADEFPVIIPAGTGVSTNNLTYITNKAISLSNPLGGGGCQFTGSGDVTAQNSGEKYNIGTGRTFTVAGYSAINAKNNDAFSGGTDKIIKVVTQDDVNKAKDTIGKRAENKVSDELKKELQKGGYLPIEATFKPGAPSIVNSPEVGAEATEVTVTSTTTYAMMGVRESDLKQIIKEAATKELDPDKQSILDNGINNANFRVESSQGSRTTIVAQTTVVVGPKLNENLLKQDVVGKKKGEIIEMLKNRPGINDVEVNYQPFWVNKAPKSTNKITIVIQGNSSEK